MSLGMFATTVPRVRLSITHKCLGDWRACYASIAGCRSAAEAVRELPLRAGLKRCGVAEAGGWVASRCFGWAGFQMLRFAQHDSKVGYE